MSADAIRRCPSCDTEHAPAVMRCVCGALLAGLDLIVKQPKPVDATPPAAVQEQAGAGNTDVVCSYDDCGQPNPAGSQACVYCNRAMVHAAALTLPGESHSLVNLPKALKANYRIVRPLPTQGAEAELLLVEALTGGPIRVAKIYRQGILPKREVQERIARIDLKHRVEILESNTSDGYAYELMEFCALGSWREHMRAGPLSAPLLLALIKELATAIAEVHTVDLIHRDLKPENILVRTMEPLDLVLTDFGISSILDATQRFTSTARTLSYAPPESLSGVIDGKSDYWALGMIVLECTLGKHPFTGLSESVILHHLTTRSISLDAVRDMNVRKLLRGLLLRDPKARWGADELQRWLASDASLAEPAEEGAGRFGQPYHIAKEICHTPEQLAVALARNWQEGIADTTNGRLLAWFRDVQKDQNVVRLLFDVRHERPVPVDEQLLKLILHLAPGIPPVWRGETIELAAILKNANLALKGDAAAVRWLDVLYQHRVLEIYAKVGNQGAARLVEKWHLACDNFAQAWEQKLALIKGKGPARDKNEIVLFDDVMYGQSGPSRPSFSSMHARLLAIAFDASWAERLRKRLIAELSGLLIHCPWFAELGEPQTMDAASLLVLEALLPEARKTAERQIKSVERQRQAELDECQQLRNQITEVVGAMRSLIKDNMLTQQVCEELTHNIEHHFQLIAKVRAIGRADIEWRDIKNSIIRVERLSSQMLLLLHKLAERRAVNAGWLSHEVLGFVVLAMILLPVFVAPWLAPILLVTSGAVAAWRLVPILFMMRDIKALGGKI